MPLGKLLRSAVYCRGKGSGHALRINTAPEAIRLSNSRMREETDAGAEGMSRWSSSEACLSLVGTGVRERERGNIVRRGRTCVAIDERMGG